MDVWNGVVYRGLPGRVGRGIERDCRGLDSWLGALPIMTLVCLRGVRY